MIGKYPIFSAAVGRQIMAQAAHVIQPTVHNVTLEHGKVVMLQHLDYCDGRTRPVVTVKRNGGGSNFQIYLRPCDSNTVDTFKGTFENLMKHLDPWVQEECRKLFELENATADSISEAGSVEYFVTGE
jgi:hypothetical protein